MASPKHYIIALVNEIAVLAVKNVEKKNHKASCVNIISQARRFLSCQTEVT